MAFQYDVSNSSVIESAVQGIESLCHVTNTLAVGREIPFETGQHPRWN